MRTGQAVFAVVLFGLGLAGCKPDAAVRENAVAGGGNKGAAAVPAGVRVDPATAGAVSGVVSLSGKPPERLKIDMSQDPVCSMTGGENEAEQYVVHGGKLANVYVYVKSGPAAAMNAAPAAAAGPAVLDQKGCRYTPHVIAIQRGGTVEFLNSDATMHNIHTMPTVAGNEVIDVSQGPKGAPQMRRFDSAESMLPVRCNNHPWMNAFLNISATPFFAVTGEDGTFSLAGLPAGDYTLGLVHEKMGEQTVAVTVKPHETAKVSTSFAAPK